MKLFLLFFLLNGLVANCFTQSLSGKVFEISSANDTVPVPGVVLRWANSDAVATTDASGNFVISRNKNSRLLIISYTGYDTDTVSVESSKTGLDIFLSKLHALKEVEVVYRNSGSSYSFMNTMQIENIGQRELARAACCNLSESFETNPSIDVNFSDAISGTKQIQLLGLSGQYALITKENMPYLRGLAAIYGLSFIPGTWINSIQLSKGAGSVVNGFESFTGQINTELQQADNSEKLFFNAYVNANARNEYNLNLSRKLSPVWSTVLLSHYSRNPLKQDMNKDGFIDIPTGSQYNFMNRWSYQTRKRFEGQIGMGWVQDERFGGQMNFNSAEKNTQQPWYGIGIGTRKWDVFTKNGYVFRKPETSMGLQLTFLRHEQNNFYGLNAYQGIQETFYANYIYQGIIKTTSHKFKLGASFLMDKVKENYREFVFSRNEKVPGVFTEYSFSRDTRFNCVAGLRADYHNYYGFFLTPRLHARYSLNDNKTVFRVSAGRAWKTANFLAENSSFMATSREFVVKVSDYRMPYGLNAEQAWNYGINFMHKFKLDFRDAQFIFDVYRTDFVNQIVIDVDADPTKVFVYNLQGKSFSNTLQTEFIWEVRKRMNLRLAYRFIDTKTQYQTGLLPKYLLARHRAFLTISYESKNQKWQWDYTITWNDRKRMPETRSNPHPYHMESYSPSYFLMNAQVRYQSGERSKWDVYLGVENLNNVQQMHAVVSADNPFGKYFDASMVWGPIYGRMFYAGVRYKIK